MQEALQRQLLAADGKREEKKKRVRRGALFYVYTKMQTMAIDWCLCGFLFEDADIGGLFMSVCFYLKK